MRTTISLLLVLLICVICPAQTANNHDEFVYNRRLIKTARSYAPPNGFVPDKATALAVAYAVALPILGKRQLDEEKPLRAELEGGVWTVLGTLNCGSCVGGTLVMQIDKASGKVLFLTHTQ
jgi:hypothetical protein